MITRKDILQTAEKMVNGDRQDDYGTPENNFSRIAELWCAYLGPQLNAAISPVDVAAMLSLLKIARIASGHGKSDNWIDLAGYAACGGELQSMDDGEGHAELNTMATPPESGGYELEIERMLDNSIQCLASVVKDATLNALKREGCCG